MDRGLLNNRFQILKKHGSMKEIFSIFPNFPGFNRNNQGTLSRPPQKKLDIFYVYDHQKIL